jgi:hypothetical protein
MLGTTHGTLRFDQTGSVQELSAAIDALTQQAQQAAQRRGTLLRRGLGGLGCGIVGGPLIAIVAAVVGGLLSDQLDPDYVGIFVLLGIAAGVFLGLIGFVVGIVILMQRAKIQALTLEPEKLDVMRRLLAILAHDVQPGAPLRLYVDFAAVEHTPCVETHSGAAYTHRWLHLEAPLAGKTRLTLAALTRLKKKERRKRKYTKKKETFQDVVDLRVAFRGRRGLSGDAVNSIQTRFAYAFPRLLRCRVTERVALLRFATGNCVRLRGRQNVDQGLEQRLDSKKLEAVLLRGFRAVVASQRAPAYR